jgi:hypothetical protein
MQNAELLTVKAAGTYHYHSVLKGLYSVHEKGVGKGRQTYVETNR